MAGKQARRPSRSLPPPAPDGPGPALESRMGRASSLMAGEHEGREAWDMAFAQDVTTSSHFPARSSPTGLQSFVASKSKTGLWLGLSGGAVATPRRPPHQLGSCLLTTLLAESPSQEERAGHAAAATLPLTSLYSNYLFSCLAPTGWGGGGWCLIPLCNQPQPTPGTSQAPNNHFGNESNPLILLMKKLNATREKPEELAASPQLKPPLPIPRVQNSTLKTT